MLIFFHYSVLVLSVSVIVIVYLFIVTRTAESGRDIWFANAPSIITSIGIGCTFLGLTLGLLGYDPTAADGIEKLLMGLKIAFIPSLVAVGIAIRFRWVTISLIKQSESENLETYLQATNKILLEISRTNTEINNHHIKTLQLFNNLHPQFRDNLFSLMSSFDEVNKQSLASIDKLNINLDRIYSIMNGNSVNVILPMLLDLSNNMKESTNSISQTITHNITQILNVLEKQASITQASGNLPDQLDDIFTPLADES